ncbi:MAG: flagellar protein FlgN [Desulfobacteraceae bacterium]|nr:MAG: flagellar protein FlgN [Desulfobacteraceae bacterium]
MDRLLTSFIEILRQTESMYDRLSAVIEIEKEAALDSDINRLTSTGAEKQSLMSQIAGLDRQRTQLLQLLAKALALPPNALTLAGLTERIDPPYKAQLSEIRRRLNKTVDQVRHSNEEFRMLVRHCLQLVQNTLGFFQQRMDTANVYGASGDMRTRKGEGGRLLSDCA